MYRIALVGAPGSGKQDVIRALGLCPGVEKLGLSVIHNAGTGIESIYGQAVGPHGSYREDLWTFFKYLDWEHLHRNKSYITSGTGLESIGHAMVNLTAIAAGIQTNDTPAEIQQRQLVMAVLTSLFLENWWTYNFVFILSYPDAPEEPSLEYDYGKKVHEAQQAFLEQLGLWRRFQQLTGETPEAKALEIVETIQQANDKLQAENEEEPSSLPDVSD